MGSLARQYLCQGINKKSKYYLFKNPYLRPNRGAITPTNHTFSYLDDIADIDTIRGYSRSSSRVKFLRRDEETSASVSTSGVTPSSVVRIFYLPKTKGSIHRVGWRFNGGFHYTKIILFNYLAIYYSS